MQSRDRSTDRDAMQVLMLPAGGCCKLSMTIAMHLAHIRQMSRVAGNQTKIWRGYGR